MTAEEVITSLPDIASRVPFIVITGQGHEEIAVKMMKLGARDYLTKGPLLVDLLPAVVKETSTRIEMEEELASAERGRHCPPCDSRGGRSMTRRSDRP